MGRILSFILMLTFFALRLNAQLSDIIPAGNFDGKPLNQLITNVEGTTDLTFFYLKEWTDTIVVVQPSANISLDEILKATLEKTGLNYFIDNKRNIILSQSYKIEPLIPSLLSVKENEKTSDNTILEKSSFVRNEQNKPKSLNTGEIISIGTPGRVSRSSGVDLSGVVTEMETGLPIFGVAVYVNDLEVGTITDLYGYYVLSIPPGPHDILFKYMGRKDQNLKVQVNGSGTMNISMEEQMIELRGVVIVADKEQNVKGLQLGLDKLDMQTIKLMPSTLGEADVIKSTLLLPGVQTVGEGSSGFNVRGGNSDQNLILMDGAPLFNSSHVFGFFSVFNPDVVKDFKLYKSAIPAQYGGRLSSVLDVTLKNGNPKKISLNGGISPIAGRLSLDGPIIKDKLTFLLSGRGSYSDWLLHRVDKPALKNSSANFFDLNGKIEYNINQNNLLTLSGYISEDNFKLNFDTVYSYENLIGNLTLKHTFSKKLYVLLSGIYSNYGYAIGSSNLAPYAFLLSHDLHYGEGKADFTWFLNLNHKLNFGASAIRYQISPGTYTPLGEGSMVIPKQLPIENALENGIYINDEFNVSNDLSFSAGLRFSGFMTLGPNMVYKYLDDAPRTKLSRFDSTLYRQNELIDFQKAPEIRLTARYRLGASKSVKVNFSTLNQYLHMLSNTTAISPTDVWKVSGPNLPAQRSTQYAAGYYQDIFSNTVEASMEFYYKKSSDILEYRGGTELLMNPDLEIELLDGIGKAYGMEVLVKKKYGALNGWVSYTYSRSMIKVDSKYITDQINEGNWFPSNFDKPHDITLVANYKISRVHSVSTTMTYSTGRPITYPVGKYRYKDRELINYSFRNEYRIPDYFRWDVSLNIEGNLKADRFIRDSFSLSVYNLTGRDNAYSIYFVSDPVKKVKGYKLSVFARPIVSLTYNFKF